MPPINSEEQVYRGTYFYTGVHVYSGPVLQSVGIAAYL